MKKEKLFSVGKVLTVMFVIGAFAVIFSTKALGKEFGLLSPLSEAAIKFSPGYLVSDEVKRHKHFVLLNQLLLIDELILKQEKMLRCPPIDLESICIQVKLLYDAKWKTVELLGDNTLNCELFKSLDILVELEIVDDLLLVQKDVREFLWYFLTRYKEPCKIDFPCKVDPLVEKQITLLEKTKETLIKCFDK